jgi:hypothetical protein
MGVFQLGLGSVFGEVGKKGIMVPSLFYAARDRLGREHLHFAGNDLDARSLYTLAVGLFPL